MRGRKPKATEIKRAQGNPGKRKLNDSEPQFEKVIPTPPAHLNRRAKAEWRRVIVELHKSGVLTTMDRAALAAYASAYARWSEAEEKVNASGMVLKTAMGNLVQNPYLSIANRAMLDMTRIAAEFGMTPTSRTRVKVEGEKKKSLAEELFGTAVSDGETQSH
jgi:P27 family predicted phage terminase small subunit